MKGMVHLIGFDGPIENPLGEKSVQNCAYLVETREEK